MQTEADIEWRISVAYQQFFPVLQELVFFVSYQYRLTKCWTVPPCSYLHGGPHNFSDSPSPLGTNLSFELGWTGLGLGLGGLGTKSLGPGLDKSCATLLIDTKLYVKILILRELGLLV